MFITKRKNLPTLSAYFAAPLSLNIKPKNLENKLDEETDERARARGGERDLLSASN
jgi:hypothetical protein